MLEMEKMTPPLIMAELNKHIIGQEAAKRAVAIALRNRWRRQCQSDPLLRDEITPKNILMIGPTGVGKTEIARRLAKLAQAPFIKVEATKFTEVGYVGRDAESIIRDLVDMAVKQIREISLAQVRVNAEALAEDRILDALLPGARGDLDEDDSSNSITREKFRKRLRAGRLADKEINIEVSTPSIGVEIMAPPGMEEMSEQLQGLFESMRGAKKKDRRLKVSDAFELIVEEESVKLVNEEDVKARAVHSVEQQGIVFLDEIDKITGRSEHRGADVSREGVQRDILPLIEGATVSTRYGMVKTNHILFIASGAFHLAKPSDLIPELQGRLPIRVELNSLNTEDFAKILVEPDASLTEQYTALMEVEGVSLVFLEEGVQRIAEIASKLNESAENIGARRLHTILEKLLETLSFDAADRSGDRVLIDAGYVDSQLDTLLQDDDLSRYIL